MVLSLLPPQSLIAELTFKSLGFFIYKSGKWSPAGGDCLWRAQHRIQCSQRRGMVCVGAWVGGAAGCVYSAIGELRELSVLEEGHSCGPAQLQLQEGSWVVRLSITFQITI